jgi:glycosyltransferase involved in cell wall biosynthesis
LPSAGLPLVSIITPSYNMGAFIGQAAVSVLSQDYPRIEYIVVDGASTDNTLDVLRPYEGRLRLVSRPDSGPAEAINRGFAMSSGSIFAWLNADDTYLPGAVRTAVEALIARPSAGAVYGEGCWTDVGGKAIGPYPTRDFDPALLAQECIICQPACFMRRELFERVSMLDAALQFSFDYDLWIRASAISRFERLPQALATSRMHGENRTLGQRPRIFRESMAVLARHYGYVPFQWLHSYCSYLLDGRDQFYEPLRPTFFKYLLSLPVGCWYNRRQLGRYWREWRSQTSVESFARMSRRRWEAAVRCLSPRRPE